MKTKEYPLITCSTLEESDILFSSFRFAAKVDLASAKEMVANRLEFAENKKHYLIVDASNVRSITASAKTFLQHPEGGLKDILGAAILASNPVSSLIANIFIKTPKDFQAKFFHTKKDALNWIHELRQKTYPQHSLKALINQPIV